MGLSVIHCLSSGKNLVALFCVRSYTAWMQSFKLHWFNRRILHFLLTWYNRGENKLMLILYKPKSTVQLSILFQALHSVFSGDSKKTELQICTSTTTITDSQFKVIKCNLYSISVQRFNWTTVWKKLLQLPFLLARLLLIGCPRQTSLSCRWAGLLFYQPELCAWDVHTMHMSPLSLSVLVMSTELLAHLHICRLINQNNIFIAKI